MQRLVSTATLPMAIGRAFFEYEGIFEAFTGLDVDGVELVFLPEWDRRWAPVTPTSADWRVTPKLTPSEIADICLSLGIAAPVVHLNRDIGTRLCSPDREDVLRAQNVLSEDLAAASRLNSEIGVLHLWDTYAESIDIDKLFARVAEVSDDYRIRLAIENIPVSAKDLTVADAWNRLCDIMPQHHGFTLDLNWCSLYDNFTELTAHLDRVLNVHVQGAAGTAPNGTPTLVPRYGHLDVLDSLAKLCEMGYDRFATLELNRPTGLSDFEAALCMIHSTISAYFRI